MRLSELIRKLQEIQRKTPNDLEVFVFNNSDEEEYDLDGIWMETEDYKTAAPHTRVVLYPEA